MSWTSPKTMGSEVGTSSDWNTYVRDNELYLYGVAQGVTFSGTRVVRSSNQSISDNTETAVSWSSETFDYGGWWSSGTNIVVPAGAIPSGYTSIACILQARAKFASNGTGNRKISALVNGSSQGGVVVSAISGETTDVAIFTVALVAAADIITFEVRQTSGGNLNVTEAAAVVLRYAPAT